MNDFEQKIIQAGKSVSMTERERANIRAQLISHIKDTHSKPVASPYVQFFSSALYRHSVSFAFVAVLFFTGGLSTLADKALPGALLYPLKTGINEKVLSWFAVSEQSKKQLSITLAERRLFEAETIATEPNIPETVKVEHVKMLDEQLQKLEGGNARTQVAETEPTPVMDSSVTESSLMNIDATTAITATEAPMLMKMSAPAQDATTYESAAVISDMTTPAPVSGEEIKIVRDRIRTIRANLVIIRKEPSRSVEALDYEAKLLRTQRSLLSSTFEGKTDEEKRTILGDANAVLSEIELFLDESKATIKSSSQSTLQNDVPVQNLEGSLEKLEVRSE